MNRNLTYFSNWWPYPTSRNEEEIEDHLTLTITSWSNPTSKNEEKVRIILHWLLLNDLTLHLKMKRKLIIILQTKWLYHGYMYHCGSCFRGDICLCLKNTEKVLKKDIFVLRNFFLEWSDVYWYIMCVL